LFTFFARMQVRAAARVAGARIQRTFTARRAPLRSMEGNASAARVCGNMPTRRAPRRRTLERGAARGSFDDQRRSLPTQALIIVN
jgi:hypothetical protein